MGQISGHPFCRDHASLGRRKDVIFSKMQGPCFKLFDPKHRGAPLCKSWFCAQPPSHRLRAPQNTKTWKKWHATAATSSLVPHVPLIFPNFPKLGSGVEKKTVYSFCWYQQRYSHFSGAPWPTYLLPSKALIVDLWTWCDELSKALKQLCIKSPRQNLKITPHLCSSHHHKCILWSYPCECFNESCKTGTNTCMHQGIVATGHCYCDEWSLWRSAKWSNAVIYHWIPCGQLASAVKSDNSQVWMVLRIWLCNVSAHKRIEIMLSFQDFCHTTISLRHTHRLSPVIELLLAWKSKAFETLAVPHWPHWKSFKKIEPAQRGRALDKPWKDLRGVMVSMLFSYRQMKTPFEKNMASNVSWSTDCPQKSVVALHQGYHAM